MVKKYGKNAPPTEVLVILDKSGSMWPIQDDVIGSMNAFFSKQKKLAGKCRVTLLTFDSEGQTIYESKDIRTVPELTTESYQPKGSTALLDAIGNGMLELETRIRSMETKPQVLVSILTDGMENASKEFTLDQVNALIDKVKKADWEIVFLAAGIDAIASAQVFRVGNTLGIPFSACGTVCSSSAGMRIMGDAFSIHLANFRSGSKSNFNEVLVSVKQH